MNPRERYKHLAIQFYDNGEPPEWMLSKIEEFARQVESETLQKAAQVAKDVRCCPGGGQVIARKILELEAK